MAKKRCSMLSSPGLRLPAGLGGNRKPGESAME